MPQNTLTHEKNYKSKPYNVCKNGATVIGKNMRMIELTCLLKRDGRGEDYIKQR